MIAIQDFSKKNSILNRFVAEIRDAKIQTDPMRFRRNLERIGEILAYEISKTLTYEEREVTTPLGTAKLNDLKEEVVIGTILRAGLPMHQGVLNFFDRAENAFVSAYRKHVKNQNDFEVQIEYLSCPDINDKVLILTDPMLATGTSMMLVYKALLTKGTPRHVHIVSAIASMEGVRVLKRNLPKNCTIWLGAIDAELTAQAYIVPGLGDAGDLAFGEKT